MMGAGSGDGDCEVAFASQEYSVFEDEGEVVVVVTRTASEGTVSVNYETRDETANAGEDYIATSGTLVFSPGETKKKISVPIVDDEGTEPDECFVVALLPHTLQAQGTRCFVGPRHTTRVYILDNDPNPEQSEAITGMGFQSSKYTVMETDGVAIVTVVRSSATGTVTIGYLTADETATAGKDYVSTRGILKFGPGETKKKISVPIVDDDGCEDDESFIVKLLPRTLKARGTALPSLKTNSRCRVFIVDNDSQKQHSELSFASPEYTVTESQGQVVVEVTRTRDEGTVSILFSTFDETACAGEDYVTTQVGKGFMEVFLL